MAEERSKDMQKEENGFTSGHCDWLPSYTATILVPKHLSEVKWLQHATISVLLCTCLKFVMIVYFILLLLSHSRSTHQYQAVSQPVLNKI